MPFDSKVFRVLIASPSDVGEERNVIPEIINEWNASNTYSTKFILMPVKWETHSAPQLGDRPQAIINEQLVKDCDLLVGVFWTRIGTHTGISISGTAEEIEQFVNMEKPVMLYFSQTPIDPERIEIDQFTILRGFKEKMRLKGLTETYSSIPDFRQKFSRQLSINIGTIISSSPRTPDKRSAGIPKKDVEIKKESTPNILPLTKEKLTLLEADEYVTKAVNNVADDTGWAYMGAVGQYLRIYTPFDYHDFGFGKLKDFLKSRKKFEIKETKKSEKTTRLDSAYIRIIQQK